MRISNTKTGSDSVGDDRDFEEEVEDEDDDNNLNEEDEDINSEFENDQNDDNCEEDNEEEDEEELFEDELNIPSLNKINLNEFETVNNLDFNSNSKRFNNRNNHQNIGQNVSCFNVKTKKKSSNNNDNKEAGLWWDEDEALNELTSSISFEFGNHRNQTQCHDFNDYDEEVDELDTLETMLRNSDLFRNDNRTQNASNTTAISSSSTTMIRNNPIDNQCVKRLSLS